MEYVLGGAPGIVLAQYGLRRCDSWVGHETTPFGVWVDGIRIDLGASGPSVTDVTAERLHDGSRHTTVSLRCSSVPIEIDDHTVVYAGTALVERWQTVRNVGAEPVPIDRLDSIALSLPPADYEIVFFESGWGREFEMRRTRLQAVTILESRTGRSSQGIVPWFALLRPDGQILSAAVMWSGNWIVRFEREPDDSYSVSAGINDWEFFKELAPGEAIENPHVAVALLSGGDLNGVSSQFARVGRQHWYPHSSLSDSLPVEWNHWWSYEDRAIDGETFLRNAEVAAAMGVEVCTLDAGWFGPADAAADWFAHRGDWDTVNTARFPHGLRPLADRVHALGMKFGLWCEIEGLGTKSHLAQSHPDFVAMRDAVPLGYVCLGNPAARAWAYNSLDRLITTNTVDWVKLDFNLDPGAGCNRIDHGHGAGDGLYEHYLGLYDTLRRIRHRHPDIVLESCSSGGLRIDLGILRQTHFTFLSDPDWPEHSLRAFWGASAFLAPEVLLHWSFSLWLQDHPQQTFDPGDPTLTRRQVDFYLRVAMLHAFGFSQRLPELPPWVRERFTLHIALYKEHVRRFIPSAELHRLSDPPKPEGRGNRWVAFQFSLPDRDEHLIFVFRLRGAGEQRSFRLHGLDPEKTYTLTRLGDDHIEHRDGERLDRALLHVEDLVEEECALLLVQ